MNDFYVNKAKLLKMQMKQLAQNGNGSCFVALLFRIRSTWGLLATFKTATRLFCHYSLNMLCFLQGVDTSIMETFQEIWQGILQDLKFIS